MKICKTCGEGSIIEETEDGKTFSVCTDCGTLDNETPELTSEQQFRGTTITDGNFSGLKNGCKRFNRKQKGFEKWHTDGKLLIAKVGAQMKLNENMIEGAQGHFELVFNDLFRTSTNYKQAMCIACLFVETRNSGRAIRLIDLCNCLNEANLLSKCSKAVYYLRSIRNVQIKEPSVDDKVEHFLQGVGMDQGIIELTKQVMDVVVDGFLSEGRSIHLTVICAGYFAWHARTTGSLLSKTFKKYCDKFGFTNSTYLNERKQEVKHFLVSLAKELPWMSNKDKIRASDHINDIIKNKSYLLVKAKLTKTEVIKRKLETDVNNTNIIDPTVGSQSAIDVGSDTNKSSVVQRAAKKRKYMESQIEQPSMVFRNCPRTAQSRHSRRSHDGHPDKDSGDQLTSCVPENGCNDSEEIDLGSDDDTDIYILNPDEVLQRKEALNKFEFK
ncbi:transcription factor IIIB 50 kDa subunit-like [Dreissena polymorpha]|uniref:BRF2-like C-terminal domain-containing protein n=1 Tax=Dreissena polymorpha TaxID=45954 RepID=A0A9D4F4D7_DREPO|nr:transcription factor IIIB 50 kDa subunit-like [Dreissena polymorpha]KAH3789570.1 hypothetical protein DPMN_167752 [Dreissena polymorpha]